MRNKRMRKQQHRRKQQMAKRQSLNTGKFIVSPKPEVKYSYSKTGLVVIVALGVISLYAIVSSL